MKYLNKIIIGVFFTIHVFAQNGNNDVVLITDRLEYIAGETVWFSIYSTKNVHQSKLTYNEIVSPFGYVINREKTLMNHGVGHGSFIISDTLTTGEYTIISYTNGLKNKGYESFFTKKILIYNPEKNTIQLKNTKSFYSETKRQKLKSNSEYLDNNLHETFDMESIKGFMKINGIKDTYKRRNKISFIIEATNLSDLNLCVSVSKYMHEKLFSKENKKVITKSCKNNNHNDYYYEIGGVIISGTVKNEANIPVNKSKVYLNEVGSNTSIQMCKTDKKGRFQFLVDANKQLKDLVIISERKGNTSISFDNRFINDYSYFKGSLTYTLDSQKISYLNDLYINYRINKLFDIEQNRIDTSGYLTEIKKINFYDYADKVVHFDDYILLDSIQEYFYEFFPSILVKNRGRKKSFRIINSFDQVLQSQPAIFIDGVFYEDNLEIFNVSPKICNRIEVIKTDVLLFDKIYGGVICLYTNNSNLKGVKLPINSTRIEFECFDKSDIKFYTSEISYNIPNFRNTLFWKSDIKISKEQNINLEFNASDAIGEYLINVTGITENNELINYRKVIKIVR